MKIDRRGDRLTNEHTDGLADRHPESAYMSEDNKLRLIKAYRTEEHLSRTYAGDALASVRLGFNLDNQTLKQILQSRNMYLSNAFIQTLVTSVTRLS